MEQEQVVASAVPEELRELAAHHMVRLVEGDIDLEVADLGIAEHAGELLGIAGGSAERAQLRILVVVGRDDQRLAAADLRLSLWHDARSRRR